MKYPFLPLKDVDGQSDLMPPCPKEQTFQVFKPGKSVVTPAKPAALRASALKKLLFKQRKPHGLHFFPVLCPWLAQ